MIDYVNGIALHEWNYVTLHLQNSLCYVTLMKLQVNPAYAAQWLSKVPT